MAEIIGVVTNVGRAYFAQQLGGLTAYSPLAYFIVGEGGWVNPGTGAIPRTPDATFDDIDAILDASRPPGSQRYPADGRGSHQKAFIGGDLTYSAVGVLRARCFLDFGEFNDDGNGNSPEIWEVGVYTATGILIGYGTFPMQPKDIGKQIDNTVRFDF